MNERAMNWLWFASAAVAFIGATGLYLSINTDYVAPEAIELSLLIMILGVICWVTVEVILRWKYPKPKPESSAPGA